METTTESTTYTKYPTFDGEKEAWPFFKIKMESCLARADLGPILTAEYGNTIPRDDQEAGVPAFEDAAEDVLEEANAGANAGDAARNANQAENVTEEERQAIPSQVTLVSTPNR